MELIKNINTALSLLDDGYILYINEYNNRIFFRKKENIILVKNDKYTSKITEKDFVSLFQKNSFYYLDPNELNGEAIDVQRDEEYYSWRYK